MKIFLIGYMGCGKSTVGKLLAEKLKMNFIDLDTYIETERGKIITELFKTDGEEKFRLYEHEYLQQLLPIHNVVISLGGGTPCFHNNIEIINKNGISVYIEMSTDALVRRLSVSKHDRPLISNLNEVDLKYFIKTNLKQREVFYKMSKYTLDARNLSANDLAERIANIIKKEKAGINTH